MVKHVAHVTPGRIWGHHHESRVAIAICSVCDTLVIRWSLMDPEYRQPYIEDLKGTAP